MPATGTSQALLMAYEKAKKPVSRAQRWVNIVTALSTAAIIVSRLTELWPRKSHDFALHDSALMILM